MQLCVNKYMLLIGLIVILNLKGFVLLPDLPISIEDLTILVEAFFWLYVIATSRRKIEKKYKVIIVLAALLVVSSSVMAYVNYGQPLLMGIRAQRSWLMAILMYFPLSQLIKSRKITVPQLMNMLDAINFIYMAIMIAQFIAGPNHLFLNVRNSIRYGSLRLAIAQSFLCISYFYHLHKLLTQKKCFKSFLIIAVTLFTVIFVNKGRASTILLIVPSVLMLLSSRLSKRKLALLGGVILIGVIFLSSSFGTLFLDSIFGETSTDAGTLIREVGRVFYIDRVLSSPLNTIFGCGFANIDWPATYVGIRYGEGITYNDNGIYGLIFYYGFSMVVWIVVFTLWLMHDSWKSGKKIYVFMLLRSLLGLMTLFPECYTTNIGFALLCVIIESGENMESDKANGLEIHPGIHMA